MQCTHCMCVCDWIFKHAINWNYWKKDAIPENANQLEHSIWADDAVAEAYPHEHMFDPESVFVFSSFIIIIIRYIIYGNSHIHSHQTHTLAFALARTCGRFTHNHSGIFLQLLWAMSKMSNNHDYHLILSQCIYTSMCIQSNRVSICVLFIF